MQEKTLTDIDIAISYLKTKDRGYFEETLTHPDKNGLYSIVLLYYSAKGQLSRKIQSKKENISPEELEIFERNKIRLENLKKEVEQKDLKDLSEKYNEAILMSALVQSIRDNEANALTYNEYLRLKEKFVVWSKIIKSEKILLTWKDFRNALNELEDWMSAKKDTFLPVVEKLVAFFETNEEQTTNEDFFIIMKDIPEKEIYYIICNVLLTNPILRKDFLSISMLSGEKLLGFERILFSVMDILNEKTDDNILKGLIILFKQQVNDQRPELIN